MNFKKSLIAASAFVAMAGAAHAAVETNTLTTNGSVTSNGYTFSQLSGTGSLTFSSSLITALNLAQVKVDAVAPPP